MINILKKKLFTKNNKLNYKQINKLENHEIEFINKKTSFLNKYLENNKKKLKIKNLINIRLYCLFNNITKLPICKNCNKKVLFGRSYSDGFNLFCSIKCSSINNTKKITIKSKIKLTNNIHELKEYFYKNIQKKHRIVFLKNNEKHIWFIESLKSIFNLTNELNDNALIYIFINNLETLEKNNLNSKEINNILKQYKCNYKNCNTFTRFINYKNGFKQYCSLKCANNDPNKQIKQEKLYFEKHGVSNPFSNKEVQNKIKQIHLRNLGVENPSKNKDIINKIKETNNKKYNSNSPLQNNNIKNKLKTNFLNKNGVENPSQLHITNYENYNKNYIKKVFIQNDILDYIAFIDYFNIHYKYGWTLLKKLKISYKKTKKNISIPETNIHKSIFKKQGLFNTKKIIPPYEIDLYIENRKTKKIGIEYNGLMFHSFGKSKYSMFNNFEDEKTKILEKKYKDLYNLNHKTYKNNEKHLLKTELCENKNIKLFHINENEWLDTQKQLIWKSIINNELGNNIIKIGARNTYIKELNTKNRKEAKLKKEFLDNNHIQGNIASNTNIGLFTKKIEHNFNKYKWYPISNHIDNNIRNINNSKENNEIYHNMINNKLIYLSNLDNKELYIIPKDTLVSLMTFGKPRFNKEYNWELLRFCNKINSSIVGAGTKLLKYFKNNYMKEDDKLISYGNRRWTNSHNNFYINNGFTFLRKSEPSFYYFHESNINKLYHRTHFQKYKLENYFHEGKYNIKNYDKTLPAQIIMYNNDYRKIWDSGNLVFELIYTNNNI